MKGWGYNGRCGVYRIGYGISWNSNLKRFLLEFHVKKQLTKECGSADFHPLEFADLIWGICIIGFFMGLNGIEWRLVGFNKP